MINMDRIKKIIWGLFIVFMAPYAGVAQVRFVINAPTQVAQGSQFRVSFSVNANARSFRGPNFKGFNVLSGPNQSQSSSTQIINGQASSQIEISFSYVLEAPTMGTFTIGSASVIANNQSIQTKSHTISVVKGNAKQAQGQQQTQATIGANDLFLRAVPNKSVAYQGEEVLILYKLYFSVPILQYGMAKLPASNGFWSNELSDKKAAPKQYSESYNGRNYNVADLRKLAVYPQKGGRLTINPLVIELVAQLRQQRQRRSLWDDFFGDAFQSAQNVKKTINSNSVAVQVLPFPEPKPAAFNGVVGNYSVECKIDRTLAKTNDALVLTVKFSGNGNLNLIEAPQFDFPPDFEAYDPKIKDNIKTSLSGISGTRTFEYLIIPRNPGRFTIKPIEIVTFNPARKSYLTYNTPEFSLTIEKGNGYNASSSANIANQKDIKYLGSDIRFIKTTSPKFSIRGYVFAFSWSYFLILTLLLLIFIGFVIVFRKQIAMRKNLGLMRNKRASKLAHKRLKKAYDYMKNDKKDLFFVEISQVIWGFVADKCNISTSQLSMDSISLELSKIEIEENIISDFVNLLNDCEFARFAPSDSKNLMQQFYERAFNAIITLEKVIKHV